MPRKCDITRSRDVSEKITVALAVSLMVCTGFHKAPELLSIIGGPAGCTQQPAFTFHVEAGVADNTDNLPAKASGQSSSKVKRTTTTTTEPTTPAPKD
jgi:hypothetical protein